MLKGRAKILLIDRLGGSNSYILGSLILLMIFQCPNQKFVFSLSLQQADDSTPLISISLNLPLS